jgi:uncharacterized membrane protein YgcG
MIIFLLLLWLSILAGGAGGFDLPPLRQPINDSAKMFPPASLDDLTQRLHRFKTETATNVVVLTLRTLGGEDIESIARAAFAALPVDEVERRRSVVVVAARLEHQIAFRAGAQLQALLPEAATKVKLEAQAKPYWDGLRPDLGIHGAVYYLTRVIRGDVRVGSQTEEEKLEETSLRGQEAGAIFAFCLAPFLAFFISSLWGIFATQYGVQRFTRLLMGAIFGGATAKIIATLMSFLGTFSDTLWYFIMALAIPLGVLGSLTEFWMSGDWSGIPRIKERQRKPEDKMGI